MSSGQQAMRIQASVLSPVPLFRKSICITDFNDFASPFKKATSSNISKRLQVSKAKLFASKNDLNISNQTRSNGDSNGSDSSLRMMLLPLRYNWQRVLKEY